MRARGCWWCLPACLLGLLVPTAAEAQQDKYRWRYTPNALYQPREHHQTIYTGAYSHPLCSWSPGYSGSCGSSLFCGYPTPPCVWTPTYGGGNCSWNYSPYWWGGMCLGSPVLGNPIGAVVPPVWNGWGPSWYGGWNNDAWGSWNQWYDTLPLLSQADPFWFDPGPPPPVVPRNRQVVATDGVIGADPWDFLFIDPGFHPGMFDKIREHEEGQLGLNPAVTPDFEIKERIPKSTPAARKRAEELCRDGDAFFRLKDYRRAQTFYREAVKTAEDYGPARYRLATVNAATEQFTIAGMEFKKLLQVEPSWVTRGERWKELFGEGNGLARQGVVDTTSDWLKEDLRDPEKLFVMGMVLHANNDSERAEPFFQAAEQFGGKQKHLTTMLRRVKDPLETELFGADGKLANRGNSEGFELPVDRLGGNKTPPPAGNPPKEQPQLPVAPPREELPADGSPVRGNGNGAMLPPMPEQ